jgi:hypothetical protein
MNTNDTISSNFDFETDSFINDSFINTLLEQVQDKFISKDSLSLQLFCCEVMEHISSMVNFEQVYIPRYFGMNKALIISRPSEMQEYALEGNWLKLFIPFGDSCPLELYSLFEVCCASFKSESKLLNNEIVSHSSVYDWISEETGHSRDTIFIKWH